MYETAAAIEAWRYLQAMGCTLAVYELNRHDRTTNYVAISQHGRIIATGVDASEGLANVRALIEAMRTVIRTPQSTWTTPS